MSYLLNYLNWNTLHEASNGELSSEELKAIPVLPNESGEKHSLNPVAAAAYAKMVDAANADGINWGITDSYRTLDVQKRLAIKKGLYSNGGLAATPGTSNHGWGSAVDLDFKSGSGDAASKWLITNAKNFGFSTIPGEPWHWEHKESAKLVKSGEINNVLAQTNVDVTPEIPNSLNSEFDTLTSAEKQEVSEILGIPLEELEKFFKNNTQIDMSDIRSGQVLLKLGSTGQQVREAQVKLKQKGYLKMDPTGTYDTATKAAVENFQRENSLSPDGIIGPLTYPVLFSDAAATTPKPTPAPSPVPVTGNTSNIRGNTWQEVAANYIAKKEGFAKKAGWDQNAYRGGYGSDKVLKNGVLVSVTKDTTFTEKEALDTLREYSIPKYSDQVIKDLGMANWNKLNNNQKAALISLSYNAGAYFISARSYGKKIKKFIEENDLVQAGKTIYTDGPKSGAQSGYIPALEKRRKEESEMFLA